MKCLTDPALEDYCAAHSEPPSPILKELEDYTREHCANPQMLVGSVEGAFLQMLVRLAGVRDILEIGLYTGYSALSMAEALPADGSLLSCDINPDTSRIAQSFFDRSPHGKKIHIALGPALETLAALPAERHFDMAFLDADKENYPAYYDAVLPRLRRGGLLVADNVLWSGAVLKPERASDQALVAFNRRVRHDTRVEAVMLTVRDGMLLARKR